MAGASLCGLLVATAAAGVPALPLAALAFTLALASGSSGPRWLWLGGPGNPWCR